MTCAMCGSVGCPYCRGVIHCAGVTYRSPLAHRGSPQERRPVRSDLASRLETKGEGTDQEPGAVGDHRVNVVGHHAPDTAGACLADVSEHQVNPPKSE